MELIANTKDVGRLISCERKRQGYTQKELADLCGVGVTYVSSIENGKATAEIGKALRIMQSLGIDVYAQSRT